MVFLDNFEISLAVLLPNTTTSHAITYTNLAPTEAKCLLKILLIAIGSLVTVFPTLEVLTKLIGLAFVDFRPIMLFIPS